MALIFLIAAKRKGYGLAYNSKDIDNVPKSSRRRFSSLSPTKAPVKMGSAEKANFKELQRYNKGAWVCIRAAGVIAKAQRKTELLAGDSSISSQTVNEDAVKAVSNVIIEDIFAVNDEKMIDSSEKGFIKPREQDDKREQIELTCLHVLNYVIQLRRHCNYVGLAIGTDGATIVRTPRGCYHRALKLSKALSFLASNLLVYKKECTPLLPMEIIYTILSTNNRADRESVSLFTYDVNTEDSMKLENSLNQISENGKLLLLSFFLFFSRKEDGLVKEFRIPADLKSE